MSTISTEEAMSRVAWAAVVCRTLTAGGYTQLWEFCEQAGLNERHMQAAIDGRASFTVTQLFHVAAANHQTPSALLDAQHEELSLYLTRGTYSI